MFDRTVFSLATAHATLLKPSFVSESRPRPGLQYHFGCFVPVQFRVALANGALTNGGSRIGSSSEFNQSGDVSDALQNMMLQHGDMRTCVKHYLPRRLTADTRATVSSYEPQTTQDLAYDILQPQRRLVGTNHDASGNYSRGGNSLVRSTPKALALSILSK